MIDGLARLVPVVKPLLEKVDTTLAALGAPPTHPVWRLLGAVGVTPGALVESVAELEPERLRSAAEALRERARSYGRGFRPGRPAWDGVAAGHYATIAAALHGHADGPGSLTLAGRLRQTASYVESVADWQQATRDEMAHALVGVMSSGDAVILRTYQHNQSDPTALTAAVTAAAEVGVALLRVAEAAGQRGRDVIRAASGLEELVYRPPTLDEPPSHQGPIRLP